MNIDGFEAILRSVKKTSIKEIAIESKLTKIKIVRKDEEIKGGKNDSLIKKSPTAEMLSKEEKSYFLDIPSPQIGFFNRYNPKTRKQYFKLRDVVKKGDIVGTIVSMHIHHNIISEVDGKITEFLVEQDQPVEYDQPLIRLTDS